MMKAVINICVSISRQDILGVELNCQKNFDLSRYY